MDTKARIDDLVRRWLQRREDDSPSSIEQLCADCPELYPAVRERLRGRAAPLTGIADEAVTVPPAARQAAPIPPAAGPETGTLPPVSPADGSVSGLPRQAGRFQLLGEIARGGMGAVLRGRDPDLGRELAVKIVLAEHGEQPEVIRRFLDEAKLAGQLQHPGVVPIYELGKLDDGRPFFAMKLIQGRTLAELLAERPDPGHELPRFLRYFEAICQTVGYAHAQGVIHRDLKPLNVMVGAFGEVQVMDWGLAKVLDGSAKPQAAEASAGLAACGFARDGVETQTGAIIGTPTYMPPEQAGGETHLVDRRSDVFGLGAILCEILTGAPPFRGSGALDMLMQSVDGDLSDACERLDNCGANAELIGLARRCLSANREDRPANGGAVTEAVAAHLSGVQERLRQAEVGQARAEARAEGERKRRQLAVALAAAVLLLLAGGGSGAWFWQQQRTTMLARQREVSQKTLAALERGGVLLEDGWQSNDGNKLQAAKAEAERAVEAAAAGADADSREQAADFAGQVAERLRRWEKNRELLSALLDISEPRETVAYRTDEKGQMTALAQPSVDEQYAGAFRRWGVDVDAVAEKQLVERLRTEPEPVVAEIVAGLDAWMFHRRGRKSPQIRWQRLLRIAGQADRGDRRRQLRAVLAGQGLLDARTIAGLTAFLAGPGKSLEALSALEGGIRERLRRLREQMEPAREPVSSVLLLSRVCVDAGDRAGAEEVLRQALAARPDQVVLFDALGKILEGQGRPRLAEAIECYRAARAVRPQLGLALGMALVAAGRAADGEAVMRDLVRQQPNHPATHFYLGWVLAQQKKLAAAEAAYRQAICLQSDYAEAQNNLGTVLRDRKKPIEAEAAYRQAIALRPDLAAAHSNLGTALRDQKKLIEAEAAFRQAIALQPDLAAVHYNLGSVLRDRKKLVEAEAAYRQAIALQPDFEIAHANLGVVLLERKKLVAAETVLRHAIALQPDDAIAHTDLGNVLREQKKPAEAEAAYRKAIALQPDLVEAHVNLGNVLREQKKLAAAEAALRQAIALRPDFAAACTQLGVVLQEQKRLDEAEAAHHQAIALQPDYAEAHNSLGILLHAREKWAKAEAAYRKAIDLQPDFALAHYNLGNLLSARKKFVAAEAAYRHAIALQPDDARMHYNLGNLLDQQEKWVAAEAAYRQAIALQPDHAEARSNLGNVLHSQKKLIEAEAAYREAIAVQPDLVEAHTNLGLVLRDQKKLVEAEAALRKAIALRPNYAIAHNNLGVVLRDRKKLAEALDAFRTADRLLPNHPLLRENVRDLERLVRLEGKWAAYLAGKEQPANAREQAELGSFCSSVHERHRLAVGFFRDAFKADGKLADDLQAQHRYNAACCAALAAAGKGADATALSDRARARLRGQALEWLRADLKAYEGLIERSSKAGSDVRQRLDHWLADTDFAGVRDKDALGKLPQAERDDWGKLWADVKALRQRIIDR